MSVKIEVFVSNSCPHCPSAVNLVAMVKEEIDGLDVEILNVNDFDNRQKALDYQIMAVPSIAINGKVEFLGTPTKEDFVAKVKTYL